MEENKPLEQTPLPATPTSSPQPSPIPAEPMPATSAIQPPPTVVKKSNKKIFIIAGVIILLLVLVMGGAFAFTQMQPTQVAPTPSPVAVATPEPVAPDPMADWITYTDKEYGFQFKHPSDWEVRDMLLANGDIPGYKNYKKWIGFAPVSVKEDINGGLVITSDTFDEMILENTSFAAGSPNKLLSQKEVTEPIEGVEIVWQNTATGTTSKRYVFTYGGSTYVLNGDDQILSTFKFTE
jgi:hypothetical protein